MAGVWSKLTGDGVLAEFGSAVDALSAAIELQQGMADANRNQPEPDQIVFRAGVHLGDVIVEANDLYGDAVNVAARLQAEAPPGGILISRAVREAVDGRDQGRASGLGRIVSQEHRAPHPRFPRRVEGSRLDGRNSRAIALFQVGGCCLPRPLPLPTIRRSRCLPSEI